MSSPAPPLDLPWPKLPLRELALPAGVRVPAGALQKSDASAKALLMRSTSEKPLSEQVASLVQMATIISKELDTPVAEAASSSFLKICFDQELLMEGGYKHHAGEHPANLSGLAVAGLHLKTQRGALLSDVALKFCEFKQYTLHALRERFGEEHVYVPEFFDQGFNFDPTTTEERKLLLERIKRTHGSMWDGAYDYVCESLNVMRLPVLRDGSWRVALLPNSAGAPDDDVREQVAAFYNLLSLRAQLATQGDALSAADVKNLKAVLPVQSRARGLVDYLIAKFAPPELREKVGMKAARAKRSIGLWDKFVRRVRVEREAAFLKVAGKTIKRTDGEVKDLERVSFASPLTPLAQNCVHCPWARLPTSSILFNEYYIISFHFSA